MRYTAIYASGDNARVQTHTVEARAFTDAGLKAETFLMQSPYGVGASWSLVAIVREDAAAHAVAALDT